MQKGTLFGIISLVALVSYIGYNEIDFQTQTVYADHQTILYQFPELHHALADATYNDGTPISASHQMFDIYIDHYEDVSPDSMAKILSAANKYGYSFEYPLGLP